MQLFPAEAEESWKTKLPFKLRRSVLVNRLDNQGYRNMFTLSGAWNKPNNYYSRKFLDIKQYQDHKDLVNNSMLPVLTEIVKSNWYDKTE